MATRRKYKVPAYRDGGRVSEVADVPIPDDAPPPAEPAPAADESPLQGAIASLARAEALRRQQTQPQQPTVEQYVDSLPGLSEHKRIFLKANPEMLAPENVPVMSAAYHAALRDGVVDDSAEMDQAILTGVARHLVAVAPAPQPPAPAQRSVPVSAPVARSIPMAKGEQRPGSITLNRDEIQIAHVSWPHLSPQQAEFEYYKNKKLMLQRKRDGIIQGDR